MTWTPTAHYQRPGFAIRVSSIGRSNEGVGHVRSSGVYILSADQRSDGEGEPNADTNDPEVCAQESLRVSIPSSAVRVRI